MANHHAVLPSAALKGAKGWTDERVEKLLALNEEALSASQIATALGGITRSSVIGKLNRLGMGLKSGDAIRRAAALSPGKGPSRPAVEPAKPNLKIMGNGSVVDVPDSPRKPWVDPVALQERANAPADISQPFSGKIGPSPCKWPIGHPTSPDFHFCQKPAVVGKPYCPGHVQRAYQPRKEADPAKALMRSVRRYA